MPTITITLASENQEAHFHLPYGWYTVTDSRKTATEATQSAEDGWTCNACKRLSWHRRRWCYFCGEPRPTEHHPEADAEEVPEVEEVAVDTPAPAITK